MQFQSTRPRGARLKIFYAHDYTENVSIHAPAWGATGKSGREALCNSCFNPRARVGRDKIIKIIKKLLNSFNPRARVGRDYMHFNYMHYIKIIQ